MMNRPASGLAVLMCAVLGLGVSGCGEKLQSAGTRKGDAAPSQGASQGASKGAGAAFAAQGWKPGDATSWDTQIKKRSDGQNEYSRTSRQ